jgi:hypothetical protein
MAHLNLLTNSAVERRTEKLGFTKAKFAVKKAKRKQRRLDDLARIREARHNLDREQERVERAYVNDMERMGQAEAGSERSLARFIESDDTAQARVEYAGRVLKFKEAVRVAITGKRNLPGALASKDAAMYLVWDAIYVRNQRKGFPAAGLSLSQTYLADRLNKALEKRPTLRIGKNKRQVRRLLKRLQNTKAEFDWLPGESQRGPVLEVRRPLRNGTARLIIPGSLVMRFDEFLAVWQGQQYPVRADMDAESEGT